MTYSAQNKLPQKEKGKEYCFLAGSMDIDLSLSWRKEVINEMEDFFHFFDPTRLDHNELNDIEMKKHIEWELDALHLADSILLNLLPNSKSPISLVELGLYVKHNKLIVVCPEIFYQKRYIEVLCDK